MGTYSILTGSLISSQGVWKYRESGGALVSLTSARAVSALAVCNSPGSEQLLVPGATAVATASLFMNPSTTLSLDTGDINRLNFPPGFLMTNFKIGVNIGTEGGGNLGAGDTIELQQGLTQGRTSLSPVIDDTDTFPVCAASTNVIQRTHSPVGISALFNFDVVSHPFGFIFNDASTNGLGFSYLRMDGDYVLWSSTLTLTSPVQMSPGDVLAGGTTVQIDDANGNLDKIVSSGNLSGIEIHWIDGNGVDHFFSIPLQYIIVLTAFQLIFIWPPLYGTTLVGLIFSLPIIYIIITAIVLDPTFSPTITGPIPIGSMEVVSANASGVYTIVPGKTDDTLYDNDDPGTTEDVKIPDPFFRTGFVGG